MEFTGKDFTCLKFIKEDPANLTNIDLEDSSVLCSFCGKQFAYTSLLDKHQLSCPMHRNKAQSSHKMCAHCGKVFAHKSSLHRHETICREGSLGHKFKCPVCFAVFGRVDNYNRHYRDCDPVVPKVNMNATCKLCHKLFCNAQELENHTCITKKKPLLSTCLYDNCKMSFYRRSQLTRHLRKAHGNRIEEERNIVFRTMNEFLEWKLCEERATLSCFTKRSGTRGNTDYYYCQLDGSSKPHCKTGEPARKTNRRVRKGTTKKDRICLAKMKVKIEGNGSCKVLYQPTHSHKLTTNDHRPCIHLLDTVKYINEQLSMGISPKKCFQAIINGTVSNIESKFVETITSPPVLVSGINTLDVCKRVKIRNNKDDAISVMIRVALLSKERPNPIILYKPLGADKVIGPNKVDKLINSLDLFILCIQTKQQRTVMLQFSQVILSINWTDDTNSYGYRLLTLVVPDEHNRGYPVAFFIFNEFSEAALSACLLTIRENCPNLVVSSIIIPDNALIIGALQKSFQMDIVYMLCLSDVHKTFQEYLNNMVPKELVFDMYQSLCYIIECEDELDVKNLLGQFIESYTEAAPRFISFLKEHYLHRVEQWTLAYRKFPHGNVDTTVFNGSIHNKIKATDLHCSMVRRLDDLISILLDVEEDCYKMKYVEEIIGIPYGFGDIRTGHADSLKIPDGCITQLHNNLWEIASDLSSNKVYEVVKFMDVCTSEVCYFTCDAFDCNHLCSHLYSCTCEDKNPLCCHIHKLQTFLCRGLTPKMIVTDLSEEGSEIYEKVQKVQADETSQILREKVDKIQLYLQQLSQFMQNEQVCSEVVDRIESRLQELVSECNMSKVVDADDISQVSEQNHMPVITSVVKNEVENTVVGDDYVYKDEFPQENFSVVDDDDTCREMIQPLVPGLDSTASIDTSVTKITKSFTPSLDYANLCQIVIKTGTEELSLLDLKSLDPFLTRDELCYIQECSQYRDGYMYPSVINSFLLHLQLSYHQIAPINSDIGLSLERIEKAKVSFTKELLEKEVFIMPMNLSDKCWACVAIFIKEKEIIYFNPLGKIMKREERTIMNFIKSFEDDIEWAIIMPNYSAEIENDSMGYGVHVCHFAEEIARQTELSPLKDVNAYRRHIYETVVGGCLKRDLYDDSRCGKCYGYDCPHVKEEITNLSICCNKCKQWYHNLCIGILEIDVCNTDFTCPI